jgi:hypothetical protein
MESPFLDKLLWLTDEVDDVFGSSARSTSPDPFFLRAVRFTSRERLIDPKGQTLGKACRSLGSATPDTAPWGCSPDIPVWRDAERKHERDWFVKTTTVLPNSLLQPFVDGGVHRP